MGLFKGGKGNTNKPVKQKKQKAPAAAKGKKPAKGKALFGKKKELTLIERMQLEESVAAASLDVVQEIADRDDSAVRELDEGLLIIAFMNEHLVQAGLSPETEDFGSFAEALRSESIESIALAGDLEDGVIGIIPSQESLVALDEFEFAQDMEFNWALVAFDLADADKLQVLDDTVSLARLTELANSPDIELGFVDGRIETLSEGEAPAEFDDYPEDDDVPEDEYPTYNEGIEDDEPEFGGVSNEDVDDEPLYNDFPEDDDLPMDADFDDNDDAFAYSDDDAAADDAFTMDELPEDDAMALDLDFDTTPSYDQETAPVDENELSHAETKEAVNRLVNHGFNNTELDLAIDMRKFDDYFDAVTVAQFDTSRDDGSELQNVLVNKRKDANTEIKRFRQDNLMELRNKFTTSMREVHNKLIASLDHRDEGTTYGAKSADIYAAFDAAMADIDRNVSGVVRAMNKAYNESREEYGENAKREAFAVYDTRFKPEHDRKVASVRDTVSSDIKTERDIQLAEMYQDRRGVAKRLFDKAETALLQTLQQEYRSIAAKELEMYDTFRKSFDVYGRRHFSDEVLRAKAEAERLRQKHEAEHVRQEYAQMLLTKEQQLQEAANNARESMRQLELTHGEQIESVRKDYAARIEREKRDNEELRKALQESNESVAKVGEQKAKEQEHTIKLYEDRIKSQDLQIDNYERDMARTNKPLKWIAVAVGTIGIALGIIFGFLLGAGSTDVQVAPGMEQAQPSANDSSYYELPSESFMQYDLVLDEKHAA